VISRATTFPPMKSSALAISPETRRLFWLALAGAAILTPTLLWGIPSSRDLSNHFRFALPFYDSLRAGHLSPGWLAESNGGYGDASFRFYPPALYYLLAFARAITSNWLAATVLTATLLSVSGALGIYFWARELMPRDLAMWAGIFYATAPYHLNQFFQAFMLAEFAGAAVLPFAFAFTERVCKHRRARDIAGLAAVYAILILTHLPLAVIGSVGLFVYAILRIDAKRRWATFAALALSVALGLAASACYWTTMLFELKWIRADNIAPDPTVDYRGNFVLSTFSPDYLNVWWMNILLLATVAMFWPALVLLRRSGRENMGGKRRGLKALFVLLLLTMFMATPLSRPVWNLIHPLQETQFPWRWLTITSMVCAVGAAAALPFWKRLARGRKRPLVVLAAGTAAVALAFSASHIIREAYWLTPAQFEQKLSEIPGSPGVSQWWPAWVHEPLQSMSAPVEAGDRDSSVESWEPERRVFHVSAGHANVARLRTFFYPHWVAIADGQSLAIHPDKDGALLITLPDKAATVTLAFLEPTRVRYAAVLTALAWLAIGILLFKRRQSILS
jgi:hypothetical protein